MPAVAENIRDVPALRNRAAVFRDRAHAGSVLAELLSAYRGSDALVLAIPAGGVPVGAALARGLGLPLDLAVVSKITLPWNTEAGYGAVAFDGSVVLNEALIQALALSKADVDQGIAATRAKVARRRERLFGGRPFPNLADRPIILTDDGLASGYTIRAALAALRRRSPSERIVAVPTANRPAAESLAGDADEFYCANLRSGWSFAVADAYEDWHDVSEAEAADLLAESRAR